MILPLGVVSDSTKDLRIVLRSLRIVHVLLIGSLTGFLVYVLVQGPGSLNLPGAVRGADIPFAVTGILFSGIFPRIYQAFYRHAIAEHYPTQLENELAAKMPDASRVIACGYWSFFFSTFLLFGPGLHNVFMYWVDGKALNLGVVIALIVLLGLHFPLSLRWERWIDSELVWIRNYRGEK